MTTSRTGSRPFHSFSCRSIAYRHAPETVEHVLREKALQARFLMPAALLLCVPFFAGGLLAGAPWWWLVGANPLVTQTAYTPLGRMAPAPVGGYL